MLGDTKSERTAIARATLEVAIGQLVVTRKALHRLEMSAWRQEDELADRAYELRDAGDDVRSAGLLDQAEGAADEAATWAEIYDEVGLAMDNLRERMAALGGR